MADRSNPYVNALAGTSWTNLGFDNNITYAFDNSGSRAWTSAEKAAFVSALYTWSRVANVTFTQAPSVASAEITEKLATTSTLYATYGFGTVAVHQTPSVFGSSFGIFSSDGASGDNEYAFGAATPGLGSAIRETLVHEIGHALGLLHPHDFGLGAVTFPGVTGALDTGDNGLNQTLYTIMSYNRYGFASAATGHAATPMAFDIAAIQYLYGANMSYNAGDNTYSLSSAANAFSCIWDAGGRDAITYAGSENMTIDLRPATLLNAPGGGGYLSGRRTSEGDQTGGYTIANGVLIENASGGSGHDALVGNTAANRLDGNGGNDVLTGGGGADTLTGGTGNDVYRFVDTTDVIREVAGGGSDTVVTANYKNLAKFAYVENLTYIGTDAAILTGNVAFNTLTGNGLANKLYGLGGSDRLDGGGGADTLYGGTGNDSYLVGSGNDVVSEAAGGGIDTVITTISRSLASYVGIENLTSASTDIFGEIRLTGNSGNNVLTGGLGSYTLDGGAGRDTMIGGGSGPDDYNIYIIDNIYDVVIGNGVFDEIRSSNISLELGRYKNVSSATLTGSLGLSVKGTANYDILTGNAGSNVIIGGGDRDTIYGKGGADVFKYLALSDSGSEARSTNDLIFDFTAIDRFDLSAIDANTKVAGNQAFNFIGKAAFSGVAGELHFTERAGSGGYYTIMIEVDVNGDKKADMQIDASGNYHTFNAGDFIL